MPKGKGTKGSEEFEDTKEVIRMLKSKDGQSNAERKRNKGIRRV
jgi:hypothetical protein